MIYTIVPIRTVSESNTRGHWAVKHRRASEQRNTTALVLRSKVEGLEAPLVVVLTRIGLRQGLDGDNLQASLKAVRDGVADALGIDDGDGRVEYRYAQRRGRAWAVEIVIGTPSEVEALKSA